MTAQSLGGQPAPPAKPTPEMTLAEAIAIAGPPSRPSKMPWLAYDLPTAACRVGGKLKDQPGSECSTCYARTGKYLYRKTLDALSRRLDAISDPRWVEAMVAIIGQKAARVPPERRYFRWHSSGDLQSVEHLGKIVEIAERLPSVRFWLQTREAGVVVRYRREHGGFPENLTVRISSAFIGEPQTRLGLPASFIIPTGESPPVGAFECRATGPGGDGKCGACRACWDSTIPLIGFHHHGKAARRAAPQLELPMAVERKTPIMETSSTPVPAPEDQAETRVSKPAMPSKLTAEQVEAIDQRIVAGIAGDKLDEVNRKLDIAPDVAAIVRDDNFKTLGLKSKDAYFKSRCESKPYMLALEIIGNSDVEAIRTLAAEHELSWKRLQVYTTVEKDPELLVAFIKKTVANAKDKSVREFHEALREVKYPDRYGPKSKQSQSTPASTAERMAEPSTGDTAPVASPPGTWDSLAETFEAGLRALVEAGGDDIAKRLRDLGDRIRVTLDDVQNAVEPPEPAGNVMVLAPIGVTTEAKAS